jgi:hypothetical protein
MDDAPENTQGQSAEPRFIPPIMPAIAREIPPAIDFSVLFKRFFSCNPFYLLSALLLIFGMYQVSTGAGFSRREMTQLVFNMSSLQVYELLLVITAVFLARRQLWFDSTLLIGLENVLAIVPFILLTQVGLIRTDTLWSLCLGIGGLAIARFYGLKRGFPAINLPSRSLVIGAIFLVVNLGVTVAYRLLHEHKIGTKPTVGAAFYTNEGIWLVLVPALCALMALTPITSSGPLPHQRRSLPSGCALGWLMGTGVHFYCLGYIYDFDLRAGLWTPGVWVLAWVLYYRWSAMAGKFTLLRPGLLALLLVIPWFSIGQDWNSVFMALMLCNAVLFFGLFRQRKALVYLHFAIGCLLLSLGGGPVYLQHLLRSPWPVEKLSAIMGGAYLMVFALRSRDPRMGLLASILIGFAFAFLLSCADAAQMAAQFSLALLLLHSLRWNDAAQPGARVFRLIAAVLWTVHAFIGVSPGAALYVSITVSLIVFITCALLVFFRSHWHTIIFVSAAAVILATPLKWMLTFLEQAPTGLLTVLGSFTLFGLGTLAAITRPRWQKW